MGGAEAARADGGGAGEGAAQGPPRRPLRILVVTNMYPPHAYGGYELGCRDVVDRWRRRGHEVAVLTSTVRLPGATDGDGAEPSAEGPTDPTEVRRQLRLYWEDHAILRPGPVRRLRWELANRRALDRALASFRPDVCSVWAMGALSLGLLARPARRSVPVVPVICDEWPVYGPHLDAWVRMFGTRPRLGRVARALTGLPVTAPDLDALGPACFGSAWLCARVRAGSPWRFPHARVVPWGIDPERFAAASGTTGGAPWRWRLLYVGRIDPRKGVDVAIRALARCPPEATLAVVGRGDDRHLSELGDLARALGVGERVTFGAASRAELAERYRAADAVVFPPVWDEPFGMVPLEAMACGTPVVASPTGGSAEFLDDGSNCLAFPAGDAEALAGALARLAGDPALAHALATAGLDTARRFTVDRLAQRLEDVHRGAVDAPVAERTRQPPAPSTPGGAPQRAGATSGEKAASSAASRARATGSAR